MRQRSTPATLSRRAALPVSPNRREETLRTRLVTGERGREGEVERGREGGRWVESDERKERRGE